MRVRGIFMNDSDNCLPHLPTSRAWPGKQGGRCPAPTLWWRTPAGRRAARAPRPRSEPRSRRAAPPPSATRDLRWTTFLHTPHTRTRRQSDRKDQEGAEREGLKVQNACFDRRRFVHFRIIAWPAVIGPFLLRLTSTSESVCFCCHLLVNYSAPGDRSVFFSPLFYNFEFSNSI